MDKRFGPDNRAVHRKLALIHLRFGGLAGQALHDKRPLTLPTGYIATLAGWVQSSVSGDANVRGGITANVLTTDTRVPQ